MSKKRKSSSIRSLRITPDFVPSELAEVRRNHIYEIFDKLPKREALVFTPYQKGALAESDKRRFRPDFRQRRILKTDSTVSLLTSRGRFGRISFDDPEKEFPCIKRRARRRVLFAFRLTGKGAGAKLHKWTATSSINC